MGDIRKEEIEELARRFNLSETKIKEIYEEEKAKISSSAKYVEFISGVSWNKTRKKLQELAQTKAR